MHKTFQEREEQNSVKRWISHLQKRRRADTESRHKRSDCDQVYNVDTNVRANISTQNNGCEMK